MQGIVGRAFARIVNVKELLANEAIFVLSVRQTVDMIGKPLEINISSTCIKACNGSAEHVARMMSY